MERGLVLNWCPSFILLFAPRLNKCSTSYIRLGSHIFKGPLCYHLLFTCSYSCISIRCCCDLGVLFTASYRVRTVSARRSVICSLDQAQPVSMCVFKYGILMMMLQLQLFPRGGDCFVLSVCPGRMTEEVLPVSSTPQ
jgi:hypothetical protein